MARSLVSALVLALATGVMAGCGASAGPDPDAPEGVATASEALEGCTSYNGYTAAIAEATIDCIGTIGPSSFAVDPQTGLLQRQFARCTLPGEVNSLLRIDRLLSLLQRGERAPLASRCITQAWAVWKRAADAAQITVCPVWQKLAASGVPTLESVQQNALGLPRLPDRNPSTQVDFGKKQFLYAVRFAQTPPPEQRCTTPQTCARVCTAGFAGFFVRQVGENVVGDPYWWLDPFVYPGGSPYLVTDYYHPMSYAGDDVPGELFGDFARVGESCSYWNGSQHWPGVLHADTPGPKPTWLSRCDAL